MRVDGESVIADLVRPVRSAGQRAEIPEVVKIPPAWKPRLELGQTEGVGVSKPMLAEELPADERAILEHFGRDPLEWEVTSTRSSEWDVYDGRTLTSLRANFVRRSQPLTTRADFEQLAREIRRWNPPKRSRLGGDATAVVNLSDWQIGKGEGGGSEATVARILQMGADVEDHLLWLHKRWPIGQLAVNGLGDLFEQCSGHYAMQTFSTDLDRRDQMKVIWRLLATLLRRWSRLFDSVLVSAVGGNHGENRTVGGGGKAQAYTTFADNDDVTVFEIVADMLAENTTGAFDHVKFALPTDRLHSVLTLSGVNHGIVHGHQFRGGKLPQQKALEWWMAQAFGIDALMAAQILASAHYHHFTASEYSENGRTHFQNPASDGGSDWWRESSGLSAPTGTLTYLVGEHFGPRGWKALEII